MAITDTQKVDYLWKKLGYAATKTDTNANKKAPNEAIASPLQLRADKVMKDSGSIPTVQPGSSSGVVTVYPTSNPRETTADATATTNRTWKTGLTDWVSPEFGSTYQVKVYIHTSSDAAGASGGDQVFATGSGNNDEWFFDYQSGVLHFIGTNLPNGINFTGKSVYIAGARYTGEFGVGGDLGAFTFTDNRLQTTSTNEEIIIEPAGTGFVNIDAATALTIPVGAAADRPSVNQVGMIRFNTDDDEVEVYNGSNWQSIASGSGSGIQDVVDDTTPQLGGNLDLNNRTINGTGNINNTGTITASGAITGGSFTDGTATLSSGALSGVDTITTTGNVTIGGNLTVQGTTTMVDVTTVNITNAFTFEGSTADGNETTLTVVDPTADRTITLPNDDGTVMLNVVEDTTPQLGGDLDLNSSNVTGTGNINTTGTVTTTGNITTGGSLITDGITITDNNITGSRSNENIILNPAGTGIVQIDSELGMLDNKITNLADPTNNQDAATKAYVDSNAELSNDTTPQLGGNLDLDGNDITGTGDINITGDITSTGTTTIATADINGGAIDGTAIGGTTPSTGAFTTASTSGEATLASAIVSDLTDNRIVIAGTSGALEDDANLTFDGTTFEVGTAFDVTAASGNTTIGGTLDVTGTVTASGTVDADTFTTDGITITDNNITTSRSNDDLILNPSGTGSVIIDSATTLSGAVTVSGEMSMGSNKITDVTDPTANQDAATKAYVDSAITSNADLVNDTTPQLGGNLDLNSNNITGTGDISTTGAITVSGNITAASGTVDADSFTTDGITITDNNITSSRTNDDIVLDPNGTGKINIAGQYTLPVIDGSANTFLQTDGAGNVTFAAPTVSDISDLTATAAELNTLDGYNGSVTEFNYLKDLYDTGVTSTEFGHLDGVTSNIQSQIDNIDTSFTIAADSGSNDTFNTSETLTFSGTANEIETTVSDNEITIGLPDDVTISGDAVVSGNLTVNGTTTTISTTNSVVSDTLLELNTGHTGANANDIGLVFERGSSGDNATFIWDESADKFVVGTTTATGADTGAITVTTGTLVADIEGDLTSTGTSTLGTANITTLNVDNSIRITDNNITSLRSNDDIVVSPSGTGTVNVATSRITNVVDPTQDQDAATKAYVDSQLTGGGAVNGMNINLSTPTDGDLVTDGFILDFLTTTKVTDAIDDLNEAIENIRAGTDVKSTSFVSDITAGPLGTTVTLTITAVGNANRHDITWGDGSAVETVTTTTPTHTYSTNTNSPFDVTVRSYNNGGSGTGSEASQTRTDYITISTATPVVSFAAYAAASGGSPITEWDDGDTIYFENTTTNTSGATVQYTWDWGDSESDDVVSSDSDAGGSGGARIAHTFTASTETDVQRTVRLTLDSHSTADPGDIPTFDENTYKIYDTHTPTVTLDDNSGINEESTSGHVVSLTNTSEAGVGSYSTFGIQYVYKFGDGTGDVTVNAGSGAAGDRNVALSHTFALSTSDQASGTAQDYTGNLRITSNHTSSPFISSNFSVHVEPDVRANIAGTAVTTSDATGDNSLTIYDFTDLSGNNRALVRMTNTSQNADDYVYDWDDTSSDDAVTEDGTSAGSIGATIDHDYAGEGTGTYNVSFTANGTPDLTAQTDSETVSFVLKATPTAPANLSTKTLTLADSFQGTSPKLAHGFTDNTSTADTLSPADDLNTTTARRYTSGTIDTNVVNDAYNGADGTLAAEINASDDGTKAFSTTTGENGTFTSLVVSNQVDYNSIDATYPSDFYQTFDAKITKALTGYSVGLSAQRLTHTTTGNTGYVHVLRDDMTANPSFGTTGSMAEGTGGTKRYVSGIPYYNTGSPTVNVTGVTINNLVGQAYTDQSNIVEIDSGTNYESTTQAAIGSNDYTYANIDGATTMLNSGTPIANTGTSTAYAIGSLSVPITSSSVRTVETPQIRARNVNGISGFSQLGTKLNVHTAAQSGISEIAIAVSDSLGAGFDDDGVRVFDFNGDSTDTPSYTGSTNFYTNSVYSESSDPGVSGTQEATIRLGVLKHDVTDYSTGFLPVGPDRSGDTGTQYFTFAFRRTTVANFDLNITSSTGVSGVFIAAPGTGIDDSSGLNGWLDASTTYGGSGQPGSDTGNGGNGSNGCAFTSGDRIATGTALSGGYTMTLGSENMSNATGNVVLVRIALASGESVTALSVGVAS